MSHRSRSWSRPRRAWAGALASLLVSAGLAGTPLAAAQPDQAVSADEKRQDAVTARHLRSCARPALSPSVRLVPQKQGADATGPQQVARDVAAAGRELRASARAQALAVAAVLAGDLDDGWPAKRFYQRLDRIDGWETLPPTIAVHRVLGTPDPFRYEKHWTEAVRMLASLSPARPQTVESLVSAGGRAPSRCYAAASDVSALPLPPGTAFQVTPSTAVAPAADPASATGPAAPAPRRETLFKAACGTPVVAATAGTVTVTQDNPAAGPWLISVRSAEGIVSWYSHVQNPKVGDGDTVLVGQQLAEIGDLGEVDTCALGISIQSVNAQGKTKELDPVGYLTQLGAAVPEGPTIIPETGFRIATYNVLGFHLTAPGGGRPGWGNGASRVAAGKAKLEAAGVDIVILNEFESPQAAVFESDPEWTLHRATPNNVFRDGNSNGNAIAWKTADWKLLESTEFLVPYKTTLHMPVLTLENLDTGAVIRVIGVHNPASTARAGNQQAARNNARAIEIAGMQELRAEDPDIPILIAGDMNERETVFCSFTGTGFLQSSAGGSVGGSCQYPRHGPVDWIFGTLDLDFLGQDIDQSFLGRISDHPLVLADVVFPQHEAPDAPEEVGDPNLKAGAGKG
ncbi:peptidoglycan DD-metalloendopeptidase family protein [Nocardioides sp.]|uniref:peptidoglycan DD-metalloendopeptidase family protein n=1 Tax=Nocardioides sp. TaxID=35761 RepID=UPI001A22A1D3|nr:peptidoglycan DD-metalloendopeptidase family protein [Nocardioides sp.]MBJ7358179.1 peptidoglycan DD-metalloendopeptidase family protein [Nocardioides sp.]